MAKGKIIQLDKPSLVDATGRPVVAPVVEHVEGGEAASAPKQPSEEEMRKKAEEYKAKFMEAFEKAYESASQMYITAKALPIDTLREQCLGMLLPLTEIKTSMSITEAKDPNHFRKILHESSMVAIKKLNVGVQLKAGYEVSDLEAALEQLMNLAMDLFELGLLCPQSLLSEVRYASSKTTDARNLIIDLILNS